MSLVEESVASTTQWQGSWSKLGASSLTYRQILPVTGWLNGAVLAVDGDGGQNVVLAANVSSHFTSWIPQGSDLPFRTDTAGVIALGAAWVCGGDDGTGACQNDVYASIDGARWIRKTPAAPWAPRKAHAMTLFQERLWVMGGWNPGIHQYFTDVWCSSDGSSWQPQAASGFKPRFGASAVVFRNQLWLIGGTNSSAQISTTANGTEWRDYPVPWGSRIYMRAHVIGNTLYALGGGQGGSGAFTDVYSSPDGVSWTKISDGGPWKNGNYCGSFVHPGGIVVFGGNGDAGFSGDIYCYTPPG